MVQNGLAPVQRQVITRTKADLVHWHMYAALGEMSKLKPPLPQGCDLRATFERPENWPGPQWLPKPRKFCFCVTAAAPPLNHQNCCSSKMGRAKEAEWRQNHCHGGSRGCRGRRLEAQWSPLMAWNLFNNSKKRFFHRKTGFTSNKPVLKLKNRF